MFLRYLLVPVIVLGASTMAIADDADISFGGSPRMLSGKTTVVMQSEVVTMTVGADNVAVDCQFVFRNDGPACDVRIGFPDTGEGGADPYSIDHYDKPLPNGTFDYFRSYVDGKRVEVKIVREASRNGRIWHAKVVHFGRGQTVRVRDVYSTVVGVRSGGYPGYSGPFYSTSYVLDTGASWAGNIGRAEIVVHMKRPGQSPVRLASYVAAGKPDPYSIPWPKFPKGTVLWQGPCQPVLKGDTFRFVRSNFEPTEQDDVQLFFKK